MAVCGVITGLRRGAQRCEGAARAGDGFVNEGRTATAEALQDLTVQIGPRTA